MQSETHRKLVRAVGQKHSKISRLRIAADLGADPEKEKAELARLAARKTRRTRQPREDGEGVRRPRRSAGRSRRNTDDMWSDEPEEYEGSEAGSEDDLRTRRKAMKRREEVDGGKGDYQTDDFVVADSTDEDDDAESPRKNKKRRYDEEEDVGPDELEQMEARLERQEADRKKSRPATPKSASKSKADDDEADVDVESEEEDDDDMPARVRKSAPGVRRKTVGFKDDENEDF